MEEELKRDHAEMQAVIEAKQKIIDAQVGNSFILAILIIMSGAEREAGDKGRGAAGRQSG